MKNLKSLLHLIFSGKFEHTFLTLLLLVFLIITFTPFWVGSSKIVDKGWGHLSNAQSALIVILTLIIRSLYEKKNDNNSTNDSHISSKQCSCGLYSTSLPQISVQPTESPMVESRGELGK